MAAPDIPHPASAPAPPQNCALFHREGFSVAFAGSPAAEEDEEEAARFGGPERATPGRGAREGGKRFPAAVLRRATGEAEEVAAQGEAKGEEEDAVAALWKAERAARAGARVVSTIDIGSAKLRYRYAEPLFKCMQQLVDQKNQCRKF
jgi:hypothetical protein